MSKQLFKRIRQNEIVGVEVLRLKTSEPDDAVLDTSVAFLDVARLLKSWQRFNVEKFDYQVFDVGLELFVKMACKTSVQRVVDCFNYRVV